MQRRAYSLLSLVLLSLTAVIATPTPPTDYTGSETTIATEDHVPNANYIFNTVHSSMRQWGSSWNHNGMSFFLATVPMNTEIYHGTPESPEPKKGIEWLAFEPEHALNFAAPMGFGPPGKGRGRRPGKSPPPPRTEEHHGAQKPFSPPDEEKADLGPHPPFFDGRPGYLHTYRAKHDLSLLYIDGISAGKSDIGTLESQDYPLLNWTSPDKGGDPMREGERAIQLCAIAKEKWHSRIHGFIRMEMGFEIIMCSFEDHLDFVDAHQTQDRKEMLTTYNGLYVWYSAIAARFDGIGYDRVTLNYDDFVTAYGYDKVNVFPDGKNTMPRLRNLSTAALDTIRHDVDNMVLRNKLPYHAVRGESTNWQAVTDMIVTRYTNALQNFAGQTNTTVLQGDIAVLMRPFIDYSARNLSTEIERCTQHFLPPAQPVALDCNGHSDSSSSSSSPSTAAKAITSISHRICTDLLTTLESLSESQSQSQSQSSTDINNHCPKPIAANTARQTLQSLTTYLDWSTWRRCETVCAYDEVCFIPIWPLGTVAERESGKGKCMNATVMGERRGQSYWGMPGPSPGPGRGGRGGRGGQGGGPPPFPPGGLRRGEKMKTKMENEKEMKMKMKNDQGEIRKGKGKGEGKGRQKGWFEA